ncbi:MAG: 2-oxo acid dehydrogenase subunit E2 [Dehalococcoidia bacterium]|nr:2-oxo acid dehydrogenase subunit E2 [Dehalococcoidia bacterium]
MATQIVMPRMNYDMREGTVVRWHKAEGDVVSRGDVIAEIETDKATVEMESFWDGILGRIVVEEGRAVPVGEVLAVITEPGEAAPPVESLRFPQPSPSSQGSEESTGAAGLGPGPESAADPPAPPSGVRASPIARRLARERGIDLAAVTGTGPGGRVTETDVLAHQEGQLAPEAASAGGRIDLSRMRQAIAGVTSRSKREVPHFYVTSEIDMDRAVDLRAQLNDAVGDGHGSRVSVNDLIVKAAARSLERFPKFNASFEGDHLELHGDVNIAIAVALEEGLILPAIAGCQKKSLREIAAASTDLVQRAHGGTLRAEEYAGGTFAVSNLGMFDVDSFAAIIYPPNAAVLAVGRVAEQPVVRNGRVTVGHVMKATLSVDHRVADGAEGARFLKNVKGHLENPVSLLL